MCFVTGCTKVPAKQVTLFENTKFGKRKIVLDICEEHLSALKGNSKDCSPTVNQGDSVGIVQQPHAVKVEDSHIPEAGTSA